MNAKNAPLFAMPESFVTKKKRKKSKGITLKQWKKWEMNEAFIQMLHAMNTDKIFVFRISYSKGALCYSIEPGRNEYEKGCVTKDDIIYIMEFFSNAGWKVAATYDLYYETYCGKKVLYGVCIWGKK